MKTFLVVFLAGVTLTLAPFHAQGAKAKGPGAGPALPSARLRQMIDNTLPRISNLNERGPQPNRAALAAAHAEWTALAQTAPPVQQPTYAAAAGVVQALLGAVDEHSKAVADFHYSKSVHGPQDKKDMDISNGGQAPGTAWANNAKQNKENADNRKALLQKEQFMNTGAMDQWKVRVAQIGTAVEQAYTAEIVTEKQMVAARTATPAPAPPPPPASSATSASEAYSPVGTWKAPKGQWTLTDDGNFTTPTGGKGTWQWGDRAKRELELKWSKLGDGKAIFSGDGKTLQITLPKGGQTTLTR